MFKYLLAALVCTVPAAVLAAAEFSPGTVECVPQSNGSACSIQWDFVQAPRAFYQVEYLDENSLKWRALGRPYGSFHTRSEPVPAARLYRVRGCDDESVQRNCVSSKVHWAILRPPVDEIPDYLVDGSGVEMHIAKSAPVDVQIAQYNVYRLIQLLDRVPDMSRLPPMTRPRAGRVSVAGQGDDYQILAGIYENYSARREQAISDD
jgi:hypothetical protein